MRNSVWLLAAGLLLVGYGTNISTPLLVIYREELGLGDSATMAIFTVYVLGIVSTLPFAGPASDRFGRRNVFLPFVILSALASLVIMAGQSSFALILLGRFLLGVVSGAALGVGAAWMQELMGPGNEQRAALLTTIVTYFGFGIGPPISALFDAADINPLTWPYLLHVAFTALAAPFLWRLRETVDVDDPSVRARPIRPRLGIPPAARPVFWMIVVPSAIWVFAFPSTSFALFPVIVAEQVPDADVAIAAASGALTAWSALLARPIVGRLGASSALPVGMVMGVVGYILGTAAFATGNAWWVLPAAIMLGASSGTLISSALAILGERAEPSQRGTINSTVFLLAYPGMVTPILLTTAGQWVDLTTALVAVTLVGGGATLWSVVARQRLALVG